MSAAVGGVARARSAAVAMVPNGQKTVLVVDDNPMALHFFAHVLRKGGYHVLEAPSALAAQQLADAGYHLDLLLTDYLMPGMCGLELAEWFRARHPEIPVLVVTGSPELASNHGRFHPTCVCRAKTWHPQELTDAVADLLTVAA